MDMPPFDACYAAFRAKDARFDGRLFVGVTSTGIYCRPICPARTPKSAHCRFFASAAAAQGEGFRPCLRCRPETSPQAAAWRGTSNTVSRALALIATGAMDGQGGAVALAERLGVGERQLRRLFDRHLGASPVAVAQTRRLLAAKQLLADSDLTIAAIAEASGFASLRRFNDAFGKVFAAPPSRFRARKAATGSCMHVRLIGRGPFDWPAARDFLAARAVAGMEYVAPHLYARTIAIDGQFGSIAISPSRGRLEAEIRFPDVRALLAIHQRLRQLFDLDADRAAIGAHLKSDVLLAPMVESRPGLAVLGGWDPFELLVRAIVGQQISVAAARNLLGRLVDGLGDVLPVSAVGDGRLTRVFPSPQRIARADLSGFPMPKARINALQTAARAVAADPHLLSSEDAEARLLRLPGIGPWTVQYWAMRARRDGDAFPAGDIVLIRAFARAADMVRIDAKALAARAEHWRPWRAYAAEHLWAEEGGRGDG